jgi:Secretion system C-terminal sorting domain
MKKIIIQNSFLVWLLLPLYTVAQHVTEYQPNGALLVSSVVNLETVRGTRPGDPVAGFTRSVNTVQEFAGAANNNIWFLTATDVGVVANSFIYGNAGVNDRASAITQCPNGDYIILGITVVGGFDRILAFRIPAAGGAPIWSFTYFTQNTHTRGYCIKQTNDANESYMIAGTNSLAAGVSPDKILLALKINAGGAMLWNSTYFDPAAPNNTFDQPRSMVVVGNTHFIAGNRTLGAAQDIFTIGINQVAGAVGPNYNFIDNGGRADFNPYINISNAAGFVLVYNTIANIGGLNTGRVAVTPLTAALVVAGNTGLYWEAGTVNNYGHTIHPLAGGANYAIGGGVTIGATQNPTSFFISNAGAVLAGTYRRFWNAQSFTSTFMLSDPALAAGAINRFAQHNFRPSNAPNGMSIIRDLASCVIYPALQSVLVPNAQVFMAYNRNVPLARQQIALASPILQGQFFTCAGGGGAFSKPNTTVVQEIIPVTDFKVYPTLLTTNTVLNIDVDALQNTESVVSIYNMQAQLVQQTKHFLHKGNNHLKINTSLLPRGTFMVELRSGLEVQKARIIKE